MVRGGSWWWQRGAVDTRYLVDEQWLDQCQASEPVLLPGETHPHRPQSNLTPAPSAPAHDPSLPLVTFIASRLHPAVAAVSATSALPNLSLTSRLPLAPLRPPLAAHARFAVSGLLRYGVHRPAEKRYAAQLSARLPPRHDRCGEK